jgi:hypothetical protein
MVKLSKKMLRFFSLFLAAVIFFAIIVVHEGSAIKGFKEEEEDVFELDGEFKEQHSCHIYYVLVGHQAKYEMNHINSWVKKGGSGCGIQMVRTTSQALFGDKGERLGKVERQTIDLLDNFHPVILSDYLKLLSLYHSSTKISIVTDFDVELLKRPTKWLSQDYLKDCSVLWFLENKCHDETCSAQYDGRTAQITTWLQMSLVKNPTILRNLIDFISLRLKELSDLDKLQTLRVQEFSGSGPITMFLKEKLGIDYLSIPLNPATNVTLKDEPGAILRIPYGESEMICIAGEAVAGNSCAYSSPPPSSCLVKHHFEGSWKVKKTLWQNIMGFLTL